MHHLLHLNDDPETNVPSKGNCRGIFSNSNTEDSNLTAYINEDEETRLRIITRTPTHASRSVLVPRETDEMLTALDPRFFTETFDATAYLLQHLPESREALDQFLQIEISAVDIARDVVVARLAEDVRANHDVFIQGMKHVQDVDLDLIRAQIHVKNGRRLLISAQNDLVRSSLEIVKTKRNRDRVESIIELGTLILRLFEKEGRMNEALQQHSFTTAVEICLSLRRELTEADVENTLIINKLLHRVQHFLPELRQQFDKSLRQVAEAFDPICYRELLQAYITLADHAENLGFEFADEDLKDVLSTIPEIMVRCVDEIAKSILYELFGGERSSPRKPKIKSAVSTTRSTTSISDQMIESIRCAYERLTKLMHTYYLIVQWHRDPFNPSNDDLRYLHRCGIDDDDDDDLAEDDDDDVSSDVTSPRNKSLLSPRTSQRNGSVLSQNGDVSQHKRRSPYIQVLCETGMTLLRYRKIVWENLQQCVVEVLERMDTTYGFKLEHIITLSQCTTTFSDVGDEFTGIPSTKLRSILRLKCEQYITSFHEDNLEVIRMLLDTENWVRVLGPLACQNPLNNLNEDDKNGLLQLVEKRSGYSFETGCGSDAVAHIRDVFPSFHLNGNPFSYDNARQCSDSKHACEAKPLTREEPQDDRKQDNGASPDPISDTTCTCEDIVLTSSSLSGFIRLCGVYIKMMHHLPHNAWDIFRLLIKLFEFNWYAVLTSFTERERMIQLLQAQTVDSREWLNLRESVNQTAREITSGEVLLQTTVFLDKTRGSTQLTLRNVLTRSRPLVMDNASESNLYAFAERSIAVESVASQFRVLVALKHLIQSNLAERYRCLVDEVYERNEVIARELRSFMYSSIAFVALNPSLLIINGIQLVQWDIPYVSDKHNDYVVNIVRKCGEIWGALQIHSHGGSLAVDARDAMWAALIQQVMDGLFHGFSSVPKCSRQGRALMSMDLLAVQNGLDLINHVNTRHIKRGYEYVNDYIKAFFCQKEDLAEWIRLHKDVYGKPYMANLIRFGIGNSMARKELREFVLRIDAII